MIKNLNSNHTDDKATLLKLIPTGIDHTISSTELGGLTGFSIRQIRKLINELITHDNVPIGGLRHGSKFGYFIIINEDERITALAPLIADSREMEKRIRVLKSIDVTSESLPLGN